MHRVTPSQNFSKYSLFMDDLDPKLLALEKVDVEIKGLHTRTLTYDDAFVSLHKISEEGIYEIRIQHKGKTHKIPISKIPKPLGGDADNGIMTFSVLIGGKTLLFKKDTSKDNEFRLKKAFFDESSIRIKMDAKRNASKTSMIYINKSGGRDSTGEKALKIAKMASKKTQIMPDLISKSITSAQQSSTPPKAPVTHRTKQTIPDSTTQMSFPRRIQPLQFAPISASAKASRTILDTTPKPRPRTQPLSFITLKKSSPKLAQTIQNDSQKKLPCIPSTAISPSENASLYDKENSSVIRVSGFSKSNPRISPYSQIARKPYTRPFANSFVPTKTVKNGYVAIHFYDSIRNLGQTCYMGSVVRLHMSLPAFKRALYSATKAANANDPKTMLLEITMRLFLLAGKEPIVVNPQRFKSQVASVAPQFSGNEQEDAHEFLAEWHDQMSNCDISIPRVFQWGVQCVVKCLGCGHESKRDIQYQDISLSFPALQAGEEVSYALQDMIRNFFADEEVEYVCESCEYGKRAVRSFVVTKLPSVLIVHLNRFAISKMGIGEYVKRKDVVNLPLTFALGKEYDAQLDKVSPVSGISDDTALRDEVDDSEQDQMAWAMTESMAEVGTSATQNEYTDIQKAMEESLNDEAVGEVDDDDDIKRAIVESLKDTSPTRDQTASPQDIPKMYNSDGTEFPTTCIAANYASIGDKIDVKCLKDVAATYTIKGIVSHVGRGHDRGHYVCDTYDSVKKQWRLYNDAEMVENVQNVPSSRARSAYLIAYVMS